MGLAAGARRRAKEFDFRNLVESVYPTVPREALNEQPGDLAAERLAEDRKACTAAGVGRTTSKGYCFTRTSTAETRLPT